VTVNRVIVIIGFTLGSALAVGLILIGAQLFLPTKLEPNLPGAARVVTQLLYGKAGWLERLGFKAVEERRVAWRSVVALEERRIVVRVEEEMK